MNKNRILSYKRKKSLCKLAKLMNMVNLRPVPITSNLLKCFDIAIPEEETDFLISVGVDLYTYDQLLKLSGLPEEKFGNFFPLRNYINYKFKQSPTPYISRERTSK